MPTTCGFPNCKFRSRYRGVEDNRHFYRIPKRPPVLRKSWLDAIGRTEETVVSQLRICSAHFEGGEKKEGDIPVADPAIDPPLSVDLPPKEGKASDRKRAAKNSPPVPKSLVPRTSYVPDFLLQQHKNQTFDSSGGLLGDANNLNELLTMTARPNPNRDRPLVALLDGRDCSVEMPILKDVATVAFCDAQSTCEIHEKVLNEAIAALLWHSIRLEKADLEKFKALRIVVRIGSDIDNIDVQAATDLGIAVCNTATACVEETADSTISLILNLYRNTHSLAKTVAPEKKPLSVENLRVIGAGTRRVRGDTLGLVGFGRVGMAVALRAKAFGFRVIFYDPHVAEGTESALGVERCSSLMDLVVKTNCLSLHCPLNDETRMIIGETVLRAMPSGSFLINTSRSGLVNEHDLALALRSGHIKGAALDVFEYEPSELYPLDNIAMLPNVIATPRSAWFSEAASRELREMAAKEVRIGLTTRIPHQLQNCVNKEALIAAGTTRRPIPFPIPTSSAAAPPPPPPVTSFNGLHGMQPFPGFNGMPPINFPMMSNPMLAAMGGMALNPMMLTPNSAALALAASSVASGHTSPAAALSSLAAASLANIPCSAGSASSTPGSFGPPSAKSPRIASAGASPFKKEVSPSASNGTIHSTDSRSPSSPADHTLIFKQSPPIENGISPKEDDILGERSISNSPLLTKVLPEKEESQTAEGDQNGNGLSDHHPTIG